MKKSVLVLFIVLLAGLQINAQVLTNRSSSDVLRQNIMDNIGSNFINSKGEFVNLDQLEGSIYWKPNFVPGQVILKDNGKVVNTFIRYRIFDDIFELKKTKTDSKILNLKRSSQMVVKIGNDKFVFLNNLPIKIRGASNGYVLVLVPSVGKANNAVLYKRMSEVFEPAVSPKGPYDKGQKAKVVRQDYYFVKIDGKLYNIEANRREASKDFPDHNKELKDFIKDNRIRFRNDEADKDMTRLVHYYNSLQTK